MGIYDDPEFFRHKRYCQKQNLKGIWAFIRRYSPIIFVLLLLAESVFGNIRQAEEIKTLKRENATLAASLEESAAEKGRLQERLQSVWDRCDAMQSSVDAADFFRRNVGLLVDGSSYYHRYGCAVFQNASSFTPLAIEVCERRGYTECPLCGSSAKIPDLARAK